MLPVPAGVPASKPPPRMPSRPDLHVGQFSKFVAFLLGLLKRIYRILYKGSYQGTILVLLIRAFLGGSF